MTGRRSHTHEASASGLPAWAAPPAEVGAGEVPDLFRTVIDALPVLAWAADAQGRIDYFNRQWMAYAGVEEGQSLDRAWLEALHPEDHDRTRDAWRAAVSSGRAGEFEARFRRFDGMYRWFLVRSNAQRDQAGRIVRWYGTNIDIEDRRNAELASQEKEVDLRNIVDSVPGLVFTTSAGGETDFINQRLLDYFGRSLEELKGWIASDTIHPDDLARVHDHWPRALQRGEPSEIEVRLRRGDGSYRWFQYRATPMREPRGDIVRWCVLATDIDDLRRAQEALRATQDRLSRAMHLASLSELSASIAHEINQPLAAVVANGQASRRWLSNDPPNVERALLSAERIVRDGAAAADVVGRMRSLFARTPPSRQPLDLDELIEGVCGLLSDELQFRSVVPDLQLAGTLPTVAVDRVQMQQVLANLIRNAAEAMDSVPHGPRILGIRSRLAGAEVIVEVSDRGPGVEDPQAVFDSFHTTKPNGMGMGLAICRSIIEAHGGRIWLDGNSPRGARFAFSVALSQGEDGPGHPGQHRNP